MVVNGAQKLTTNLFFFKLFGHFRDIPAKSRDIPPQSWFSLGFEGHTELFGPHCFRMEDPHPTGGYPDPKAGVCALFSCLSQRRGAKRKHNGLLFLPLHRHSCAGCRLAVRDVSTCFSRAPPEASRCRLALRIPHKSGGPPFNHATHARTGKNSTEEGGLQKILRRNPQGDGKRGRPKSVINCHKLSQDVYDIL